MKDEAPRLQGLRRQRRSSGFAAWFASLVSVILILGQASIVLHFDLVPHRFCPLHGIEDVRVLHKTRARPDLAELPWDAHATARAPAQLVVAHERCALAMLVHERLACILAGRGMDIAAPGSTGLAAATLDAALLPGRRELDFAPKNGPPA